MPGIPEEAGWQREGNCATRCLLCFLAGNHPQWKLALPSEARIHPQTPFQTARWRCLPGALRPLVRTIALEGRGITSSFALACWSPLGKPLQIGQVIVTNHLLPKFMDLAVERSPMGGEARPTGGWTMFPLVYSGC